MTTFFLIPEKVGDTRLSLRQQLYVTLDVRRLTGASHALPSASSSEWGQSPPDLRGHYYPVIMCCSARLHLLFLPDNLTLEESNFTWWMIKMRRRGWISFAPRQWIMHSKAPWMSEWSQPALPAPSNILPVCAQSTCYVIIASAARNSLRLSKCAWSLFISIVFTCPLKSHWLSVQFIYYPQWYERWKM